MRSSLLWLGKPDPVATMRAAREDDPSRQVMSALFGALRDVIGVGNSKTAAEIINLGCLGITQTDDRGHGASGVVSNIPIFTMP